MARIAADHGIEVSLFVGPREEWDVGSLAQSGEGASRAGLIRGARQLRYAIDDVLRGVDHGIRGFLVADTGLLELLAELQRGGEIPASVVWKVSAMLAPANPLTVRQLDGLGASTINVPSDATLGQLAEMRAVTSLPIDLYVEAPSGMGGVVRGQEAADLVAVAAPMYTKFGLRNSRLLYPSGLHLVGEASLIAREKVHRAAVALEWIKRSGLDLVQSGPAAAGLGVPEPPCMTREWGRAPSGGGRGARGREQTERGGGKNTAVRRMADRGRRGRDAAPGGAADLRPHGGPWRAAR